MAVPHTRPIGLFAHANDAALQGRAGEGSPTWAGGSGASAGAEDGGRAEDGEGTEIVVPASFDALLEHQLGRAGHAAMGYAATIPNYLTSTDFTAGATQLLRRVNDSDTHVPQYTHLCD